MDTKLNDTRYREGQRAKILDLFIIDKNVIVTKIIYSSNLGASDYVCFWQNLTVMSLLEPAVDGAPSQIPMLKFLTPQAPRSPTPGHDLGNRMKILFNMFSIFYL